MHTSLSPLSQVHMTCFVLSGVPGLDNGGFVRGLPLLLLLKVLGNDGQVHGLLPLLHPVQELVGLF